MPTRKNPFQVLVVDDNDAIRVTLQELLEALDYQVDVAADGEEALEKVQSRSFDIVLTDVQMPKMSGTQLLNHIKDFNPLIPVVMITGFPSLDNAVDAMKQGASDFITKPFKLAHIESVMKKLIRERQLLEENSTLRKEVTQKRTIERLNRKLNRQVKELTALHTISEGLRNNEDPEDIFEKMVELGLKVTEAERGAFFLLDQETGQLHVKSKRGFINGRVDLLKRIYEKSLSEGLLKSKQPILIKKDEKVRDFCSDPAHNLTSMPALLVPLIIKGEVFGILGVEQKVSGEDFKRDEMRFLHNLAEKAALTIENNALYESIYGNLLDTLRSLINTIEAKDNYTKAHSQRVTQYALAIASRLRLSEEQQEIIRIAGYLHDIGKIGIRDSILLKPGPLTNEEYQTIKIHPIIGENIISPLGLLPQEREIIRHHHERWDGKGYPDGLIGENIPFFARLVAVADAFDAMTTDRPYRKPKNEKESIKELLDGIYTQFDPSCVEAFIACLKEGAVQLSR